MSTMSSSPRKRRTTGSSRTSAGLLAALLLAAGVAGCRRSGEVFVTYFSEHGFSLRYPASWRTGEAEQGGVRYRYFVVPASGAQKPPPLSVTLLATATATSLDSYAQSYLATEKVGASRAEERQGTPGKSWLFAAADGTTRGRLLLLAPPGRILGLHAQGEAVAAEANAAVLDEIWASFTIERPEGYPVHTWKGFDASLGVPDSWKQTQQFSGGGTMLVQFASPPLALEKRQTIHAALSLTLEPAPAGGLLEYYEATRRKLGDNYAVASHEAVKDGFVDVMRTETPLAVSYIKRYYLVAGARARSLSFEAREDVFVHASRWADSIASTLRLGRPATVAAPETPR
jgi:hypothetical protein